MKIKIFLCFLFAANIIFAQNKLTVNVSGIKEFKGNLIVKVYDEANFHKKAVVLKTMPINNEKMTVVFDNLPNGEYAVSAIVDENKNGKLDHGMFGPTEPAAASNNAKGFMGPPKFKDAKFKVEKDMSINIKL